MKTNRNEVFLLLLTELRNTRKPRYSIFEVEYSTEIIICFEVPMDVKQCLTEMVCGVKFR